MVRMADRVGMAKTRMFQASRTKGVSLKATRPIRRRRSGEDGVSVVELLVAVAIVGLVGTVMVMATGPSDRQRVRSAATALVVFLEEARLSAARSGTSVALTYREDEQAFLANGKRLDLARGVETSEGAGLPRDRALLLRPSGESRGAEIPLAVGDAHLVVRLDWLTGRLEVRE